MSDEAALVELLHRLKAADYRFTAVTPLTHARVLARPFTGQPSLRDIFGWNRRFAESDLDPVLLDLLKRGDALQEDAGGLRSRFTVASLNGDLFLHSAFPTDSADSVFFGPDTYRFARFIEAQLPRLPSPSRIVDMGAGSGAGGILCGRLVPGASIALVDVNADALRLAAVNAAAVGVAVELQDSARIAPGAELIVANPPYMIDADHRTYRDGGDLLGGQLSLDWARQAIATLRPGGTFLLYSGAAVVDGRAPVVDAIEKACRSAGASICVEEIDPDVFGEELDKPAYSEVERIAAVGIRITTP